MGNSVEQYHASAAGTLNHHALQSPRDIVSQRQPPSQITIPVVVPMAWTKNLSTWLDGSSGFVGIVCAVPVIIDRRRLPVVRCGIARGVRVGHERAGVDELVVAH